MINTAIEKWAVKYELDVIACKTLVTIESGYRQYALRFESKYRWLYKVPHYAMAQGITHSSEEILQKCSIGLCQIMGATAREFGFEDPLPALFDIDKNLEFGLMHFKRCHERYDILHDAVAAYNAGSARKISSNGKIYYENDDYVKKFRLTYATILENLRCT